MAVLRFQEFDGNLAAIPSWLPIAIAAGSLGYALYLALVGRRTGNTVAPPADSCASVFTWPSETDRRYFDSELHLAASYIELARSTRVRSDAVECRERALAIHAELESWTHSHGGDADFEHKLQSLHWRVAAADEAGTRDF